MIAAVKTNVFENSELATAATFLQMLSGIERHANFAFRRLRAEAKEELVCEVVASAYRAFENLVRRGKRHLAHPASLATYAIRQVRCGRMTGGRRNSNDVSSRYARLAKGLQVESLDRFDPHTGAWQEVMVEDRHVGPAETAAARIDLSAWLTSLGPKKRTIAEALASGERTATVAQVFGISSSRVSQMRKEFENSWQRFHGCTTVPIG